MPDYWLDQCREFLQCFDTVALVIAKASSTQKHVPLIHQRFSSRTSGERNNGAGLANPGSSGKRLWKWWYRHHHNRFMALFPGPPGWAGARRELLDFMVQGKINRGRHTDHPAGRHSIRTNQCPPPPSPFFTGRMPFLPPDQQCQSTEGN